MLILFYGFLFLLTVLKIQVKIKIETAFNSLDEAVKRVLAFLD